MSAVLHKRQYLLGATLAATIAATLWAAQVGEDDATVQPVAGAARRSSPSGATAVAASRQSGKTAVSLARQAAALSTVARAPWPAVQPEQLSAWMPPPPPPAPLVTVPAAVAPAAPLPPYELIGRLVEDGQPKALLSGAMRTLAVRVGDLIDEQWRVDTVTDQSVSVTHQPTGTRQTLHFRMTP